MRALVCVPGGVEVAQLADPRPPPGGVVVKVEACGICGSDVHAVKHGLAGEGQILGHEFSGTLAALPDGGETELGAHAEPLAVALRAVELGETGDGDIALVYGTGPIGLNVIMALRLAGAGRVIAVGRSAGRRAAAAAIGAHVVLDARESNVVSYLA